MYESLRTHTHTHRHCPGFPTETVSDLEHTESQSLYKILLIQQHSRANTLCVCVYVCVLWRSSHMHCAEHNNILYNKSIRFSRQQSKKVSGECLLQ